MSINLDNFEVDEFTRDTPFVLTSPTSLRACSELDIEVIINFRIMFLGVRVVRRKIQGFSPHFLYGYAILIKIV